MDAEKKTRFFDLLVQCGLKEIEVGFPASGATDFDYIQGLVRSGRIPDDVTPQVLTQARADLIRTSFDSLEGAKAAIRSEERRVGKEGVSTGRARGSPDHKKKKKKQN